MSKIKLSSAVFLFLFFFSLFAYPDMVYLKNREKIEGVIEEENKDRVVLNIGFGKIILSRNEIDRIKRYDSQKQGDLKRRWAYKYFTHIEYIPSALREITESFINLEKLREKAAESKRIKDLTSQEIEKLGGKIDKTSRKLAVVSKELSDFDPRKDINKYNSLVESFNSLQAKTELYRYKKGALEKKLAFLKKDISNYINRLTLFNKRLNKKISSAADLAEGKKTLNIIQEKIDEMDGDFTRYSAKCNKLGPHLLVDVLLNDSVRVKLVVDTGASLVVISKETARNLGIDIDEERSMLVVLADGRKVEANPAVLNKIKIGGVEVQNVRAAVLEYQQAVVEDGLLGMSFLKNFIVKINPQLGKLILEEFDP